MAELKVSEGQSLLDLALQLYGSVGAVFDLANANGLAITDSLVAGQVLVVPASSAGRADIAAYFRERGQLINTANPAEESVAPAPAGIFDKPFSPEFE